MNTEGLIRKLADELQPVQRLKPPILRFAKWFLPVFLGLALCAVFLGLRKDLVHKMTEIGFVFEMVLIFSAVLLSGAVVFLMSVPGTDHGRPWVRFLPALPLILWAGWLLHRMIQEADFLPMSGLQCAMMISVLGFFPVLFAFLSIRRAAPLRLGLSGAWAALAGVSLGALFIQTLCGIDQPAHLMIWHLAPLPVMALLGAFLGRRFLKFF